MPRLSSTSELVGSLKTCVVVFIYADNASLTLFTRLCSICMCFMAATTIIFTLYFIKSIYHLVACS